jgi:hypothetical protein
MSTTSDVAAVAGDQMRRVLERLNQGSAAFKTALEEAYAEDCVLREMKAGAEPTVGHESLRDYVDEMFDMVPDLKMKITAMDAIETTNGARVWLEAILSGTDRDGRAADWPIAAIYEVQGDLVQEERFYFPDADRAW